MPLLFLIKNLIRNLNIMAKWLLLFGIAHKMIREYSMIWLKSQEVV